MNFNQEKRPKMGGVGHQRESWAQIYRRKPKEKVTTQDDNVSQNKQEPATLAWKREET